ncbi:MAG: hypothetical protein JXB23_05795 [Candidatus Aminicenantes bacterium]|nr:hypothetical protein [Candidatus Aminicenantes bacterium]
MSKKRFSYFAIHFMTIILTFATICIPSIQLSPESESLMSLRLLKKLVEIPGPSLQEEAICRCMADIMMTWGISTTFNEKEPWVVGRLPGSGPKIALISHIDEPRFLLTQVDASDVAVFDGVSYAPTWNQAELAKFLTYEELITAPVIRNPNKKERLALFIPEWHKSFPMLSWTVENVYHQLATVQLNRDEAVFARKALAERRQIVAINKNSLRQERDPIIGDVVIGSPLDNRLGVALILSLSHHYKNKSIEERPNLYIVGRPREELPGNSDLIIPAISDVDLVIVVDDPAMHWYPALGGGPVIVLHNDRTPKWLVDIIMELPPYQGMIPLPPAKSGKKYSSDICVQIFRTDEISFLTVVANDAGKNVPTFFIGPTMLRYHTSEEKMSVSDIRNCEKLMILLFEQIVQRSHNRLP